MSNKRKINKEEYLYEIIDAIRYILERTPPELSADIIETGIYITGGGACLDNFDKFLKQETGLEVHLADDPSYSVINGLGIMISDKDKEKDKDKDYDNE